MCRLGVRRDPQPLFYGNMGVCVDPWAKVIMFSEM